jgi:hypothetical protein
MAYALGANANYYSDTPARHDACSTMQRSEQPDCIRATESLLTDTISEVPHTPGNVFL